MLFVSPVVNLFYHTNPSNLYQGYEPTPESGRALCAFNGTGYSPTGSSTPIPETRLCDFVNPSVAQGTDSKGWVKKTLDSISDVANRLVTRLFPVSFGSSSSAETVSSNQETVYCSNPQPGKNILGQDTTPPPAPSAGARTRTGITTKARIIAPTDPTLTAIPNPAFVQTHSLRPLGHMIEVTTYFGGTSNGYSTMTAVSTSRSATEPNFVNTTASTSASAFASLTTLPSNSTITPTITATSTNTSTGSSASSGPVQTTFSLGAAPVSTSRVDGSWTLLVGVFCLLVMG